MQDKERFLKRIRISEHKFRVLVNCFSVDCTALQSAVLAHVNRNTSTRYSCYFRSLMTTDATRERVLLEIGNGVEIDESYFGPRRVRGKRGRGASKKTIVLGLLKRDGRVYAQIIPRATQEHMLPIIRATVRSGSDIYSDGWRSYDALAIYGYNHKKVKHEENEFSVGDDTHINGIESFWSWTKRRLQKFNGLTKEQFVCYLLESEWRFNHRGSVLHDLRRLIRQDRVSGVI